MNPRLLQPVMALALLAAVLTARTARGEDAPGIIARWSGVAGGPASAVTQTLQTVTEWTAFWESVGQPPPRTLDPDRELAAVVALGRRKSGGYHVTITSAETADRRVVVRYEEISPARDARVMQMLTTPWTIAIIRRAGMPVVFERVPRAPGAVPVRP